MPAKSKSQVIAARIALAAKKRKIPTSKLKGASKQMYKMTAKQLKEFTSTSQKDLPKKVTTRRKK